MATATTKLLTAEEYLKLTDLPGPTELVRGEIVEMPQPFPRHGQVCGNVYFNMRLYANENDAGHVISNDAGVITERDPDTVRGPDVWFISYNKIPRGPLPPGQYLDAVPDVAIEVKSDHDRWSEIIGKVSEYLTAGVPVVCVLDPESETARVYYDDDEPATLTVEDELTFPQQLPGFSVPVKAFFE